MATMKEKLTPKTPTKQSPAVLNVSTASVKLSTPAVEITAPQMLLESTVIDALAAGLQQIASQQRDILQALQYQSDAIQALAKRNPEIKVDAPKVTMPARPNAFYVQLDKEDGETVGMRIETNAPH